MIIERGQKSGEVEAVEMGGIRVVGCLVLDRPRLASAWASRGLVGDNGRACRRLL